ncbi:MAG: META domain-containing protein, partial [Chloroflexales bacterium]|nr:META domain-containing protein [Chloroflexales bacterium]
VAATEVITYFNQSPYPLPSIVFRTYLNAHNPEADRNATFPPMERFYSPGIALDEFQVNGEVKPWPGKATSTLAVLQLEQPLPPGSSITFSFRWSYELADANGWKEGAVDDTTFYLAYFYPRVAVINDAGEWDTAEFLLGSEFYDDFNDYTFEVSVPKNYLVWATGDLQNPAEVLQPTYAQRLMDSQTSDETISIATVAEAQGGQVTAQSDTVTWKWQAENVRDIAIGLSDHYNWDAGSVVVDPTTGRRAGVQGAYPDSATLYKTIVEDGKRALVFASTKWPGVPYPYSKTSIFVGGADEEYPMMVNDSAEAPEPFTVGLIAGHEILHSWFPFYMGTDERRYPFMDEGWTTAFDYLLAIDLLGQEQADAYFQSKRAGQRLTADSYIPIILPQDMLRAGTSAFAYNQYGKAALAYLALKDLLGEEAFKASLHEFMARWNGKHTLPWDMFNSFNATSGEDLNWFFNSWFFSYDYMDIGVGDVAKADGGYAVTVKNNGGIPIPFDVVVTYTDATSETLHQTPAVWREDATSATITLNSAKEIASLTLATGLYPDLAPPDNLWQNPAAATATPTATPAPAAVPPPTEELTKLRANPWQWVGYSGPIEQFTLADPANYLLTFNEDATLAITADCNQAAGSYQGEGGKLTIEIGLTTLAACGDDSRGDAFLRLLGGAALYTFDGDNLRIELLADGGTLTFAPTP